MRLLDHLRKFDWILFITACSLVCVGLLSIFSSSTFSGDYSSFTKQITFFIISIIIMGVVSFYDYRKLRENSALILLFYFVSIILLAGVLFFAPNIRGIASWYKIGPISFDPIEPAKVALIFIIAKYFSSKHQELYDFKHIIYSGVYVAIPCILVFLQPDFGAFVIFACIWFGMLLVAGMRKKHVFILVLCSVILFLFTFSFLMKDYQKDRILSFTSSEEDVLGDDWNKYQSQVAIGSGGLLGKGFLNGTQAQYGFLPEPKTDFIFASLAEEFGFLGVAIMLLLYLLFFYRIMRISINSKSNFARLFGAGWAISIFAQIAINISMNLGLLPVVGLPLSLISYGGSNLLFNFICLGIMENINIIETSSYK
jgi:rod shape determining protein RodA